MSLNNTEVLYTELYATGVLPKGLDVNKGYWKKLDGFRIKTLEIIQVAQAFSHKELTEDECIGKLEILLRCGASPVLESEFEGMSALHIIVLRDVFSERILKLIFKNDIEYIPVDVINDLYDNLEKFKRLISCGMSIHTPILINEECISLQECVQKIGYKNIFNYINTELME